MESGLQILTTRIQEGVIMAATFWQHLRHHEPRKTEGENARGREARHPGEIPAKGWKDTLMRVKNEVGEDRLSMIAAAMSYYALLAFVPALTSVVLIYAWINDPSAISNQINSMSRFLPAEAQTILKDQLTSLSSKASSALGLSAIGSLLFSLWSASKASTAVMDAMNIIYDEKEKRSFIRRTGMAIWMTLFGAILSIVALLVVVGIPPVLANFHFPAMFESLAAGVGWIVLLLIFSFYLSFAYRFGPCREKAKWSWVSRGSIIASVLWAATSLLFSWYAAKFGNFNKTYGSLGAVIVLMTWFYISSFIILLGGEINSELEHQTKKDTTTGSPKPLGTRGARMADTVGASADELKKA